MVGSDDEVGGVVGGGVCVWFGLQGVALLLVCGYDIFDFREGDFHRFEFAVGEDVGDAEVAAFEELEAFFFGAVAEEPG